MHTTARRLTALCGMVVMLVLVASITVPQVLATTNGIYIATASPHYKHPATGVIEDAGGESSAVLGQAMTESATHNRALVEVDQNGNTFVTVRMKMMDNIQRVSFQVDGKDVAATCMQEDYNKNTADFRMRVNSESSVIRCSIYVAPMGRDVIFYITVSGLQPGSGDFITSIEVAPPETKPEPSEPEPSEPGPTKPEPTEPEPTEPKPTEPETTVPGPTEPENTIPNPGEPETTVPGPAEPETTIPKPTVPDSGEPKPTEPAGLQEFDASGNEVFQDKEPPAKADTGHVGTFLMVIGVIAAAAGIGFCIWYFGFFKKKR